MKTEISAVERKLLLGAVSDIETLRKGKRPPNARFVAGYFALERAIEDARHRCVHVDASRWLGQSLSASDRMAISRAYQRLEKRGLIERVNFNDEQRATHLYIRRRGFTLAREVLALQRK